MKLLTFSIISCVVVIGLKWSVILDNQRSPSRFKTEYRLEVINSDSIRILTSEHKLISCKFSELQEVISQDNQ